VIDIGPPRDERDWNAYISLGSQSFRADPAVASRWLGVARACAIVRVVRENGRVVAGAAAHRVPQLFGGREVAAGAVAGVCVAPERRGSGIARALMGEMVRAMRAQGCAVSPLWPSTIRPYRRSGWEVAGGEWAFRVPTHELVGLRGSGEAVAEPGLGAHALQRRRAADFDGPLARPEWWWRWKHPRPVPEQSFRYAWVEGDVVTGFIAFQQDAVPRPAWEIGIEVGEFWTSTTNAARGLLGFLGAHSSLVREVRFGHAVLPPFPSIAHLAELDGLDGGMFGSWMLRIIDPVSAFEARGWPEHASVRVALEIDDPFEEGSRCMVVEVDGGRARVTPGGSGGVRIDIGALSAWYAGRLRAGEAARLGRAAGDAGDLAALDGLTGDRPVWLPDHF